MQSERVATEEPADLHAEDLLSRRGRPWSAISREIEAVDRASGHAARSSCRAASRPIADMVMADPSISSTCSTCRSSGATARTALARHRTRWCSPRPRRGATSAATIAIGRTLTVVRRGVPAQSARHRSAARPAGQQPYRSGDGQPALRHRLRRTIRARWSGGTAFPGLRLRPAASRTPTRRRSTRALPAWEESDDPGRQRSGRAR